MTQTTCDKRIVVGITGASGAAYARRLVECFHEAGVTVHLVASPNGKRLLSEELGITELSAAAFIGRSSERIIVHPYRDVGAPLGSGSFRTDGMVVCPCTSNTLAAIATGMGDSLLTRAAAVTLKELRRFIVVPREMPMSRIDLVNALRLTEAGGVICPASPGFYMMPEQVTDLVDFVVGKLLDLFDVPHRLNTRWVDQLAADRQSERSEVDR
jgi:4-hydroxy-3-polyprenylbenzoate decarboxylase